MQKRLDENKESTRTERKAMMGDVEKYKKLYFETESQMSDGESKYEREKALWEGKFTFLEQQKKDAKKSLAEAQGKFEQTLKNLQKHNRTGKSESQQTYTAKLQVLEKRQLREIEELNDKHILDNTHLSEQIATLKKQQKESQDKTLKVNQGHYSDVERVQ